MLGSIKCPTLSIPAIVSLFKPFPAISSYSDLIPATNSDSEPLPAISCHSSHFPPFSAIPAISSHFQPFSAICFQIWPGIPFGSKPQAKIKFINFHIPVIFVNLQQFSAILAISSQILSHDQPFSAVQLFTAISSHFLTFQPVSAIFCCCHFQLFSATSSHVQLFLFLRVIYSHFKKFLVNSRHFTQFQPFFSHFQPF